MDVLATGSLFVWGHVVNKSHIPRYLSKTPTAPPDVTTLHFPLATSLSNLRLYAGKGPGMISFPLDRSRPRHREWEWEREMVPQVLFYTMCRWMGGKRGFVTFNVVRDIEPERIDKMRDIWGLDEAPQWYRIGKPMWNPADGVPSMESEVRARTCQSGCCPHRLPFFLFK